MASNHKTRTHAKVMVAGIVILIPALGSFAYGQLPIRLKCRPEALILQKEVAHVIPDVTGCMYDDVEAVLRNLGLPPQPAVEPSDRPKGTILFQSPPPGTLLKSLDLPAQPAIESSDQPKGMIFSQAPPSGASAASIHAMELHVSGGPEIKDDVSPAGPDLTNNSAAVNGMVENEADLSVIMTLDTPGPYRPGQSVFYTIAIRNAGPSMATGVEVVDAPVNLTLGDVSGDCGALPCQISRIASGGSATIQARAVINGNGDVSNTVKVSGAEPDPNDADNTYSTLAKVPPPASADVSVATTLDKKGQYRAGQDTQYAIVVRNAGPSAATGVRVDETRTNLGNPDVMGSCTALPCMIDSIDSGAEARILVRATVAANAGFADSVTVAANERDPATGNNKDAAANAGPVITIGIPVPGVEGMSLDDATAQVRSVGLNAGPVIRKFRFSKPDRVIHQDPAEGERLPPGASISLTVSWSLAWMLILSAGVIGGITGLVKLLWPPHLSPSLSPDVSVPDWPNAPAETAPGMSFDAHLEVDEVDPEISVPGMSFDVHLEIDEVNSEISAPLLKEACHE